MAPDDTYTHGHHDSVLRSHRRRTVENSAAYLIPVLTPGTAVLDVGCGPGTISVDIARRVAPGTVVAVDRSPEVVAEAVAAGADAGVVLDCRVGDAYALEFEDATFDVVHAHQVRQLIDGLLERRRVLEQRGDVLEQNPLLGEIRYIADQWSEVEHG